MSDETKHYPPQSGGRFAFPPHQGSDVKITRGSPIEKLPTNADEWRTFLSERSNFVAFSSGKGELDFVYEKINEIIDALNKMNQL